MHGIFQINAKQTETFGILVLCAHCIQAVVSYLGFSIWLHRDITILIHTILYSCIVAWARRADYISNLNISANCMQIWVVQYSALNQQIANRSYV